MFQISRYATKALKKQQKVHVLLDFMPNLSAGETEQLLQKRFFSSNQKKTASECMIGLLNKKLCDVLLKEAGIDLHLPSVKVTDKQISILTSKIKSLRVDITGSKNFDSAQVCAGGVKTTELQNETLESKLVSGVFFFITFQELHTARGNQYQNTAEAFQAHLSLPHPASSVFCLL